MPVTTFIPQPSSKFGPYLIPALSSIVLYGAFIASYNIFSAVLIACILVDALCKAIPAPGTIPSLSAAFVACIASSTLSFFSFSSTLLFAPTFMIPTAPDNIASLCSNFSLIKPFCSSLIFFLTVFILSFAACGNFFIVITVFLSSVMDFTASPKQSGWIRSKSSPKSSEIIFAPVIVAKSSSVSCLVAPNPGTSTTFTFIFPFTLFIIRADKGC